MPAGMTHNDCEMQKDLIKPIEQFFLESNIVTTVTEGVIRKIKRSMTVPPPQFVAQAIEKDREILKRLLQQNDMRRVEAAKQVSMIAKQQAQLKAQIDQQGSPRTVELAPIELHTVLTAVGTQYVIAAEKTRTAVRPISTVIGSCYQVYSTTLFKNQIQNQYEVPEHPNSQTYRNLQEASFKADENRIQKNTINSLAQMAASAEYSVFKGRAPGPR